jgi:hypothetical protein
MGNIPISKLSVSDSNALCQNYLHIVYHFAEKSPALAQPRNIIETSGEILYPGVKRLLSRITLTGDDVFVDLGSGAGKVVTQVFLQSPAKTAYGIEIVPELHRRAQLVAQKIQQDLPNFFQHGRQLNFYEGNFLVFPLQDATVVLINSVCFSQELLHALGTMINAAPAVHTVLTLRPIDNLQRLLFKKTIRVECSWDTALCYVYQ